MNLVRRMNELGNYIRKHTESSLYVSGLVINATDALLTYYRCNGNPEFEAIDRMKEQMYQYGVGLALTMQFAKEATIVGGGIIIAGGIMKKSLKENSDKKSTQLLEDILGNTVRYGIPTYWCIVHTIGTLSHFYNLSPLAKIWNVF